MADFGWALQQMKAGKKVRRQMWTVGLRVRLEVIHENLTWNYAGRESAWMTSTSDLLAEDWELYEEPKPEPKLVEKFECWYHPNVSFANSSPAFLTYADAVEHGESQLRKGTWARAFTVNKYYELGEP